MRFNELMKNNVFNNHCAQVGRDCHWKYIFLIWERVFGRLFVVKAFEINQLIGTLVRIMLRHKQMGREVLITAIEPLMIYSTATPAWLL